LQCACKRNFPAMDGSTRVARSFQHSNGEDLQQTTYREFSQLCLAADSRGNKMRKRRNVFSPIRMWANQETGIGREIWNKEQVFNPLIDAFNHVYRVDQRGHSNTPSVKRQTPTIDEENTRLQ
jgi:hypothetical protein